MREKVRDPQRLLHMYEAITQLLEFNSKTNIEEIPEKDIQYYGILKLLEIIGESSYKLTNEFKDSHKDTPWKIITDMRHILVHGYYLINKEDVDKTIKVDLPILQKQLESYLKEVNLI